MFDVTKEYGKDPEKISAGTWVDLPAYPGISVRVVPMSNPESAAMFDKLNHKAKAILNLRGDKRAILKNREIMSTVLISTVLKDWSGIKSDGAEVPFTIDQAKALFAEMPEFADAVAGAAMSEDSFRREDREDDAKNSESTSAGTSATDVPLANLTPA